GCTGWRSRVGSIWSFKPHVLPLSCAQAKDPAKQAIVRPPKRSRAFLVNTGCLCGHWRRKNSHRNPEIVDEVEAGCDAEEPVAVHEGCAVILAEHRATVGD